MLGMRTRSGWFVALALGLLIAMTALGACAEGEPVDDAAVEEEAVEPEVEDDEDTFTDEQATVVDDKIYEDPTSFLDDQVTFKGQVEEIVSDNVVRVASDKGAGDPLLVAYIPDDGALDTGMSVQVTGVVRDGDASAIGQELGVDLADVEGELAGEIVVVASSADTVDDTGA